MLRFTEHYCNNDNEDGEDNDQFKAPGDAKYQKQKTRRSKEQELCLLNPVLQENNKASDSDEQDESSILHYSVFILKFIGD